MEHDLVLLEDGEHRVGPGHVVANVETSAVPVPALQPNVFAQQLQKVFEVLAGIGVREELEVENFQLIY